MQIKITMNPNQNPSQLFCGYQQNNSNIYLESQKAQNSQHNFEEQSDDGHYSTSELTKVFNIM